MQGHCSENQDTEGATEVMWGLVLQLGAHSSESGVLVWATSCRANLTELRTCTSQTWLKGMRLQVQGSKWDPIE